MYVVVIYNLMSCAVPLHSALVLLNLAAVVMCPQLQNSGNGSVTLSIHGHTWNVYCNLLLQFWVCPDCWECISDMPGIDRSWSGDAPICQCKLDHEVKPYSQSWYMCTQFNCLQTNMLAALLYNYVKPTEQPSITCHLSMAWWNESVLYLKVPRNWSERP